MSTISDSLKAGTIALRAVAGESLTFRDTAITGLINWITPLQRQKEYPFWEERVDARLWLDKADLALADLDPPEAGEYITDSNDNSFRVIESEFDGLGYLILCQYNRTNTDKW